MSGEHSDTGDARFTAAETRLLVAIGAALARARQATGLSLAQAANAAAISKDYLWRLENGRQNVSLITIARLAGALGTTPSALVGEAEAEAPRTERR